MRRQQDAPGEPGDVIRLDGVTKAYQAGAPPALAGVTVSVANGEVAAIMGPSGSGKSTLLNLIAGLDRPTSGTVTVAGQRIDALGEGALARFRARHPRGGSPPPFPRPPHRHHLPVLQPPRRPHRRGQRPAPRPARRGLAAAG